MRIIDMHCDTMMEAWRAEKVDFVNGPTSINLKKLKENDSLVQFFALYLPRDEMEYMDAYDIVKAMHSTYMKMLNRHSDLIRPVFSAEDIEKNRKDGVLSSFLTIEDGVFLDGKIERVQEVYDMGVRLITLLWNFENSTGFPNSDDPEVHMRGLKPFGIEVVERMNQLGMIIDTAHLSEGGFYDVAKYSKKPFVASHSCARALCNHRRNLTDNQLKVLGETGSMVGVNFERTFLKENSDRATFDQIIQHLLYMKAKAGIDALGFGSDFDGIEDNGELVDYSGFTTLLGIMEKYFTDDEIDKICNLNALRLIKDVIGK